MPKRWIGRSAGDTFVAIPLLLASLLSLAACSTSTSSDIEATAPDLISKAEIPATTTHTLSLQTPTPAWKLVPMMLYRDANREYLCVHKLSAPDGMVAQMLSSTSNQIEFQHPGEEAPVVRHYVLGKTWNWDGNPEVTFIDSIDEIKDALAEASTVAFTTP